MPWTPPTITTDRLSLAAPTDNDQVRFSPDLNPGSESELPGLPSNWAIRLKQTDKAIGSIGYMRWNRRTCVAELGFILDATHRNQGLMTEACEAVIAFGFESMHLETVETRSFPHNLPSLRVFEKVGMKPFDQLKARISMKGEWVDLLVYRIEKTAVS